MGISFTTVAKQWDTSGKKQADNVGRADEETSMDSECLR
jgi:hypothetical protein